MNELPQTGFIRERNILGDKKATPPVPPIIPVSHSSWWNGIKDGRYPKPVKLGPRTTAWRCEDIRSLIESPNPDVPAKVGSVKATAVELAGQA